MKEVIMQVKSFSIDYPKVPIYVGELVRCKDCRYKELYNGEIMRFYWCNINDRPVDDMGFCAWGEYRGGDNK